MDRRSCMLGSRPMCRLRPRQSFGTTAKPSHSPKLCHLTYVSVSCAHRHSRKPIGCSIPSECTSSLIQVPPATCGLSLPGSELTNTCKAVFILKNSTSTSPRVVVVHEQGCVAFNEIARRPRPRDHWCRTWRRRRSPLMCLARLGRFGRHRCRGAAFARWRAVVVRWSCALAR